MLLHMHWMTGSWKIEKPLGKFSFQDMIENQCCIELLLAMKNEFILRILWIDPG